MDPARDSKMPVITLSVASDRGPRLSQPIYSLKKSEAELMAAMLKEDQNTQIFDTKSTSKVISRKMVTEWMDGRCSIVNTLQRTLYMEPDQCSFPTLFSL